MQTLASQINFRQENAASKPTLKMFIACEDKASFLRACRVRRQVEALCAHEIDVSPVFWNFALLRHEGLQEWAVMEAANAEMVIVSLHGGNELPVHVKSWAERLPERAQAGQAALIALANPSEEVSAEWRRDISYLRQVAENRGMDFFCNHGGSSGIGAMTPAFTPAHVPQPQLFANHHFSWRTGGINE